LWVEKDLRGKDALSLLNLNDFAGGQLVLTLLLSKAVFSLVDFLVDFVSYMAHLLLHFTNLENVSFLNSWCVLLDFFHELFCNVLTSNMKSMDTVGECKTFEDWHCVGKAMTTLSNETSGGTSGEERKGCSVHQTEG
jgi:hypothetical protein